MRAGLAIESKPNAGDFEIYNFVPADCLFGFQAIKPFNLGNDIVGALLLPDVGKAQPINVAGITRDTGSLSGLVNNSHGVAGINIVGFDISPSDLAGKICLDGLGACNIRLVAVKINFL